MDPASPAGLHFEPMGTITVEELDQSRTSFLAGPAVGILRSDIPATTASSLSPEIVASPHLVNIRTSSRASQRFIRFRDAGDLTPLTNTIYAVLPDAFDFFMLFSTDKVERLPPSFARNGVVGTHLQVQTNYTGIGLGPYDDSATFGSAGRLLGVNVLDNRLGVSGNVATHELLHQWVSYIHPSLGLSEDGAHNSNWTSVASLVGGFRWVDLGNSTFTRDCTEGANGAHHASPLDKYMMGLIDGSAVDPLYAPDVKPIPLECDEVITDFFAVTIEDIQAVHGIRTPGPAEAKRDFALAFVAESHDRLLDPTELTFYEILAEHYTKTISASDPDPYVGFNWPPVTRFFGEGTTWRSDIPSCAGIVATIIGTEGDDVIVGTEGDDVIQGFGGDDRISGRGGNDVICGGEGDDEIMGQGGDDTLFGDGGSDELDGGLGYDQLDGGSGIDTCDPGPDASGETVVGCEPEAQQSECPRAVAKASSAFAQAKAKALAKCELAKVAGTLAAATSCRDETAERIAQASTQLAAAIGKACGGHDKTCGGDLTGEVSGTAIGFPATCPNFENGPCVNTIGATACTGVAECVECIDDDAIDQAITLYFASLVPTNPEAQGELNDCQQAIGKLAQNLLVAKSKALQKCRDDRLEPGHGGACPSPEDAATIAKGESKLIAGICKACGGTDQRCDQTVIAANGTPVPGSGGGDDFTPGDIGFPRTCASVTRPGGASCAQTISTLADLVECVDCVTEFEVDCMDAAAVPLLVEYPSECSP